MKVNQFQELLYAEVSCVLSKLLCCNELMKIKDKQNHSSKGFLFTTEAVIVFIVLIFLFFHSFSFSKVNLNKELMFMQVQDVVEACSLKKDYSKNCIKQVEEVNSHIKISCVSFNKLIKKCPVVKKTKDWVIINLKDCHLK